MKRHLSYANVVGTLALFIALGGSSYAALAITGRDVADRSLTGRDIKPKSVPVNRLKGKLPRGRRGPEGPAGLQGPAGPPGPPGTPADVSRFYTKAESDALFQRPGELRITVPATEWGPGGSGVTRSETSDTVVYSAAVGDPFVTVPVRITGTQPSVMGGRPLRWLAAELCYAVPAVGTAITQGRLLGIRHEGSPLPDPFLNEIHDVSLTGDGCHRFDLNAPLALQPNDYVRLIVFLSLPVPGTVTLGSVTYIYESS
jgi:hypothetical protein